MKCAGYFAELKAKRTRQHKRWQKNFKAWGEANPQLTAELDAALAQDLSAEDLLKLIPEYPAEGKTATRNSGGEIFNHLAKAIPHLITGSADLYGSTKNYIKDGGDFSRENPMGRNIWFGIREHAMGAICNGIAYDGLFRASGATFLVFADYCRPSIRLARSANCPSPTSSRTTASASARTARRTSRSRPSAACALIPNLDVIRPGDAEECAAAFAARVQQQGRSHAARAHAPGHSAPGLRSRQRPPRRHAQGRLRPREGNRRAQDHPHRHRLRTAARGQRREAARRRRRASSPCPARRSSTASRRATATKCCPPSCKHRIAIEAGVTGLWWKYVGLDGRVLGIDRFGISAPGGTVMKELGMTAEAVVAAV